MLEKKGDKGNYIQSRGRRRLRIAPSVQGIPGEELPFEEELGRTTLVFPAGLKYIILGRLAALALN
jgi:hypothetical protein